MNKLQILYCIFILLSCKQKEQVYYQTTDEFAKREWFDIEEYWSNDEKGQYDHYIFINNEDTLRVEYSFVNNVSYSKDIFLKKDGNIIRQTYSFYLSGEIESKWQYWDSNFKFIFGKSYRYDKIGNITQVKDFDEPYIFTFEDIKQFVSEINLEPDYINREIDSLQSPIWQVSGKNSLYPDQYRYIELHGKTGEVLNDTIFCR
ncbi:MAG: hypothetical protein LUE98_09030 [Tannerellaceae bacterium]|nr:hypothetical protein [Tannerellaceae bacterium]